MSRQKTKIDTVSAFDVEFNTADGGILEVPGYSEPGQFTPEVKEEYDFDPETLFMALTAYLMGRPLLAQGPSGTGKTELCEQIAARLNLNRLIVSSSEETETADLSGMQIPQSDGSARFVHGSLIRGLANHGLAVEQERFDMVIWDEITKNRPGVLSKYNAFLEGRPITLDANGGEIVRPDPNVWLTATANSAGAGDTSGLYAAEQQQDAATLARFLRVEINFPDAEREKGILEGILPDDLKEDAGALVQFMNLCRSSSLPCVLGLRQSVDIATLYPVIESMEDAVMLSVACGLDRYEDRRTIAGHFQTAFDAEPIKILPE